MLISCISKKEYNSINSDKIKNRADYDTLVKTEKDFNGWWIYGDGLHIFKDSKTLEEFDLYFINEDMLEIESLYLAVSEMEYFPLECNIKGSAQKDKGSKRLILRAVEFDILHVEGCD
tara:strand:- start:532 stop:885 length:354 start_codon:yes stop_codon:yes gene_type:complete